MKYLLLISIGIASLFAYKNVRLAEELNDAVSNCSVRIAKAMEDKEAELVQVQIMLTDCNADIAKCSAEMHTNLLVLKAYVNAINN
ncbi:MAG: hypothetical protein COA82_03495 [Alkaliphilus sp.]|nr:MAG: hypothetical protein COA82_03495 [Alkaliphilus sp.]